MRLALLALVAAAWLTGCQNLPTASAPQAPPGWTLTALPGGASGPVLDLWRPARSQPTRLRVIVLPGSGCTGWAPMAERYTAGLRHAEVHLLHKPGAHPEAGLTPTECPAGFETTDTLPQWAAAARQAVTALGTAHAPPTWLVGVSEGGELLPVVAPSAGPLAGLLLLSSPGLDPLDTARLQAQRLGAQAAWQAVEDATRSPRPDHQRLEGRPLRYWRDLMHWPVAAPLRAQRVPLWQVWGSADAAIPATAYRQFAQQARQTPGLTFCSWRMDGHDHGLQHPGGADGLQQLWHTLDHHTTPVCPTP